MTFAKLHFNEELYPKPKLGMFCVLSPNYQHYCDKCNDKHPEANCLRNLKITLQF